MVRYLHDEVVVGHIVWLARRIAIYASVDTYDIFGHFPPVINEHCHRWTSLVAIHFIPTSLTQIIYQLSLASQPTIVHPARTRIHDNEVRPAHGDSRVCVGDPYPLSRLLRQAASRTTSIWTYQPQPLLHLLTTMVVTSSQMAMYGRGGLDSTGTVKPKPSSGDEDTKRR